MCVALIQAIGALKERGGSSRQAILKYILKTYNVGKDEKAVNNHLKLALRAGVRNSSLKQAKGSGASGSFKVGEGAVKKAKKPASKKPKAAKKPKAKSPKKVKAPAAAKPKKAKSPKKPKAAKPKKPKTPKKAKPAAKAKKAKPAKAKKADGKKAAKK